MIERVLAASAAVATLALAEAPSLAKLEPETVLPYQPVSLRISGQGFQVGATVFVEGSVEGRFLPYPPVVLAEDALVLELPFGFARRPRERRLYVENPDGSTSTTLVLTIHQPDSRTPDGAGAEPEEAPATSPAAGPSIRELRPSPIPAGIPVLLEVLGSGFAEGARIELTVNLHAGSTELPEYAPRVFVPERIDDGLLELELDRGFYPVPGARDLVVIHPDGSRSAPATLRIDPAPVEPGTKPGIEEER